MSTVTTESQNPPRVSRLREGRVLGGVCTGLAGTRGLSTAALRRWFLFATLLGGLGVAAYLACWLVLPEAGEDPDGSGTPGVVVLSWAAGGFVLLVLVGAGSAAATVFGYGWIVFGLAAAALVAAVGPLGKRIPGVVALLGVAALTLPAVAVALSPLRLSLTDGDSVSRPATVAAVDHTTYQGGFGTKLIDLRRIAFGASGTIHLRIDGGVRRTIVALPENECVHVRIDYAQHPFASALAALLSGNGRAPFNGVVLFGRVWGGNKSGARAGHLVSTRAGTGSTLDIDYRGQGGSLFVRDYPDAFSPSELPGWPGYPVTPEPPPYLKNEPHRLWKGLLAAWRTRHAQQLASQALVNRLMPGPCAS